MFESTAYCESFDGRRVWSACLGFMGQACLITGAVLVPLISPETLQRPQRLIVGLLPSMPVARREAPKEAPSHAPAAAPAAVRPGQFTEPVRIPSRVAAIDEPPMEIGARNSVVGALPGYAEGGGNSLEDSILRDLVRVLPAAAAPPKPVAAPAPATAVIQRVKVGGNVKMARPISQPMPRYPDLAKTARVSGIVELLAVIGTDGRIRELKVTSGNPLLAGAALQAVRSWIYEPTMLNGDPVEVVAPIIVTFHLN